MDEHWIFCLRLIGAAVLGGIIGLERELAGKHAGLRTNILICVGAALLTHLSITFPSGAGGDPGRIAAMIVSGIGFLGAGAIIQSRQAVHGLTSAATIWVVAGLGMAVGAGILHDAVLATLLMLLTLIVLRRIEHKLFGQHILTMSARVAERSPDLKALLRHAGPRRRLLHSEWERRGGESWRLNLAWKGNVADAERMALVVEALPGGVVESWKVEE